MVSGAIVSKSDVAHRGPVQQGLPGERGEQADLP
jgi:hypothetical protein